MSKDTEDLRKLLLEVQEDIQNLYAGMEYTRQYTEDIGKMALLLGDTSAALPLVEEFKESYEKYRNVRTVFGQVYRTIQGRDL